MSWVEWVPGLADIVLAFGWFAATVISPILAVLAFLSGLFVRKYDHFLVTAGLVGVAYQVANIAVQYDAIPAGTVPKFLTTGLFGAIAAALVWGGIGRLSRRIVRGKST